MAESRFLYVTYIRATPQKIWDCFTDPEMNRKFWGGYHQDSSFEVGGDYKLAGPDGRVWDAGKVLASDPPRLLRLSWRHLSEGAMQAIAGVATGWPSILSSLKSLLETGEALATAKAA